MAYDKTRTGLIKQRLIKHVLTKTWIDNGRNFLYPAKSPSRTILRVCRQWSVLAYYRIACLSRALRSTSTRLQRDYLRIYRFVFVFSVHWKTRVNDQRSWRKVENFTLFLVSPSLVHVVHHVRKCLFPFFGWWISLLSSSLTFPQIAKHRLPIRTYSVNLSRETNIASFELKVEFYFVFWAVLLCFLSYIWLAQYQTTKVIPSKTVQNTG